MGLTGTVTLHSSCQNTELFLQPRTINQERHYGQQHEECNNIRRDIQNSLVITSESESRDETGKHYNNQEYVQNYESLFHWRESCICL